MGVSFENGIESLRIYDTHVNSKTYCEIFPDIVARGKNVVLFGDQVSYHSSKYTVAEMKKYGIDLIKNVAF